MVTKKGVIKRTELSAYRNIRKSGLIAIHLDEDDELAWVRETSGNSELLIATRNGMLLVSHYNHLQNEGYNLKDTIIHGSLDRLNPILMTALSSALALIPLAIGGDLPGNEIQSPMAKVILGGLLSSTLLNAFIVPIVYQIMNHKKSDL